MHCCNKILFTTFKFCLLGLLQLAVNTVCRMNLLIPINIHLNKIYGSHTKHPLHLLLLFKVQSNLDHKSKQSVKLTTDCTHILNAII